MTLPLSARANAIAPSATLAIAARARELKRQGVTVFDFGAGEPDFPVPAPVQEAAHRAITDGKSKYTDGAGIPELRAAIAAKLARDNGLAYKPEEVLTAVGAKQALFALCQALLGPGDEALIPAPYWVSYPAMVTAAGGTPRYLETSATDAFRIDPDRLRAALTPRTRLVFLNSPSNPTGVTYPREALAAIGEALRDHACAIVTDEIYEKLVYGGARHHSLPAVVPSLRDRTIVVNGFSKSYAMTGWRLGYAAGPKPVIDGALRLIAHDTSNPTSIVQYAALAALALPDSALEPMIREFDRRRQAMLATLRAAPGVTCPEPTGAFYCFPDVSAHFGATVDGKRIADSTTFTAALLDAEQVAVVPGAAFGADRHVRLSYATAMATVTEGTARLKRFCERLAATRKA